MIKESKFICFLLFILLFFACKNQDLSILNDPNQYNLIPKPKSISPQEGKFVFDEKTKLFVSSNSSEKSIKPFVDKLRKYAAIPLEKTTQKEEKNSLVFQLDQTVENPEGYRMSVDENRVLIKAKTDRGIFYAIQTLRQLLPHSFELETSANKNISYLPAVEIEDHPRFKYRGFHLDVSRHFQKPPVVKAFIDQLAYHKINHFHWHLTDDQGWRIEIKKYPKLSSVAAFRNGTLIGHYNDQPHQFDGKRHGGFYTHEEIKDIVQYAADRHITIVPEIEMPGHAQAALAAYPELACDGESFEVLQKWGISDNVFCPTEATFEFLENVIDEVITLFPGKYIHIGGDECPKTKWKESAFCQQLMRKENLKDEHELQSYFIQRIEKHVNAKSRQIIGWDEILEGGLAPNATVMSWRGIEGGIKAANQGHDVIMTPTSHCYFDYYQNDHPDEPLAIGGLLPLEKVYNYQVIPTELDAEKAKHIIGTQANLWTEYIPTKEKIDYMAFPRLCAIAEVAWLSKEDRNLPDFVSRLSAHIKRLEIMGIKSANHLYDIKASTKANNGVVELQLNTLAKDATIHYTLDGNAPNLESSIYQNTIQIQENTRIKAQSFKGKEPVGRAWQLTVDMHKAAGKKIQLTNKPHSKYSGGGEGSIINGVLGSDERYGDLEWLGFWGKDFEAEIDLGQQESINKMSFRFFNGEGQWIYRPKSIALMSSTDGKTYTNVAETSKIEGENKVIELTVPLNNVSAQFIKIKVENFGEIPDGKQGAGHRAWLFIDEIKVE